MKQKEHRSEKMPRKSLLSSLFAKSDRDETYRGDLSQQWEALDTKGRVKFIFGALIGVILFLGALGLVYWVISSIMY